MSLYWRASLGSGPSSPPLTPVRPRVYPSLSSRTLGRNWPQCPHWSDPVERAVSPEARRQPKRGQPSRGQSHPFDVGDVCRHGPREGKRFSSEISSETPPDVLPVLTPNNRGAHGGGVLRLRGRAGLVRAPTTCLDTFWSEGQLIPPSRRGGRSRNRPPAHPLGRHWRDRKTERRYRPDHQGGYTPWRQMEGVVGRSFLPEVPCANHIILYDYLCHRSFFSRR